MDSSPNKEDLKTKDEVSDHNLFQSLGSFHIYPFDEDAEFQVGLSTLLKKQQYQPSNSRTMIQHQSDTQSENMDSSENETDMKYQDFVTNAKLFYYSRFVQRSWNICPESIMKILHVNLVICS